MSLRFAYPTNSHAVIPSTTFSDELAPIQQLWVLDGRDSRRQIVEAFISEILDQENDSMLHVLRNVKNLATYNHWQYYGHTDIVICRSTNRKTSSRNVCLVIIEAADEWTRAIPELMCQIGCWKNSAPMYLKTCPYLQC